MARSPRSARTGHPDRIARRVAALSLQRWSAGGLLPAPAPDAARPPADGDLVRAAEPLLWAEAAGARMCAAGGQTTRTSLSAPALARLLGALRVGDGPVSVGSLLPRDPAAPGEREAARRLLRDLLSFRGLTAEG